MKSSRPDILSVRAVNQYRRREIVSYLGLRYYLENKAAQTDLWARNISCDLVLSRTNRPYYQAAHFKERTNTGDIDHRDLFLPGANEALAEAALLDECARHPHVFQNPECVFSYALNSGKDRSGIFKHYIGGLKDRHDAIGAACDDVPNGVVRYTDIRRFYPSIDGTLAVNTWRHFCENAGLAARYRELGEKILSDYKEASNGSHGAILTGPMFSHLIANLVLRDIDNDLPPKLPARYIRYVDDIVLVGTQPAVVESFKILNGRLKDLGLELHDDSSPKTIEVPVSKWILGRDDFKYKGAPISWMTLIGDLKRYLLRDPDRRDEIRTVLQGEGFRLPVLDYTGAVYEATFAERLMEYAPMKWFIAKNQEVNIDTILCQARWLRNNCEERFRRGIDDFHDLDSFGRKRSIPKLRYNAGRLIYLATEDVLSDLVPAVESIPELFFHAKVMHAVVTQDLTNILNMGTNAAQAAAQPLRASGKEATISQTVLDETQEQALAVFLMNGVSIKHPDSQLGGTSEILRFASLGADMAMMKSNNPFMRELACLHGLSPQPRHPNLLEKVFDEDEHLTMDAIEQLQISVSM